MSTRNSKKRFKVSDKVDEVKNNNAETYSENQLNGETVNTSSDKETLKLKSKVGLPGSVGIITGTIVGSGIFASPTGVLLGANGSVGMSLVLWVACGVVAGLAALCYCELASMFRDSGAEYTYLYRGYKKFGIGSTLAFMYSWTTVFVLINSSNAALALVFGSYIIEPFYAGDCKPPELAVKFAASVILLLCGFLNYVSVKTSSKVMSVFTVGKFIGMGIIIVGGFVRLAQGDRIGLNNFNNAFLPEDLSGLSFNQIGLAFYQGLWAYDGLTSLTVMSEEVKNSTKTIPRAIIFALILVIVFYLLVNIGYFAVLTPEEILTSDAVAVTWGYRVLGNWGWIMSVVVCLSTLGSLTGGVLLSARYSYAAARKGHLPQILGMITVDYYTPGPSVILLIIGSLIFLIPADFSVLVNAFSFTSWFFQSLVIASVIILRFTHKDRPRPFKVPIPIPILSFIFSLYLLVAPLVDSPDIIILYAAAFVFCSPLVYFVFVYKKWKLPGTEYVTMIMQRLLNVAPTNLEEEELQ